MTKPATFALIALLASPSLALACSPNDFSISDFNIDASRAGQMAKINVTGKMTNNCTDPAGVQLAVLAKNNNGSTVKTQKGWPMGSTNVPAGATVDFNFGALFDYSSNIKNFSAAIVSARTW